MKKKYDIKTTDVETLKKWYHLMILGRALDEKAPSYQLQSLGWSYHAPYAGHDGIQLAVGQVFTLGEDFLFPYYRDMLTVLSAGMTAEEIILNGISKATDPGSGVSRSRCLYLPFLVFRVACWITGFRDALWLSVHLHIGNG